VDATFVPWLWASVNMAGGAAIISAVGPPVAVPHRGGIEAANIEFNLTEAPPDNITEILVMI